MSYVTEKTPQERHRDALAAIEIEVAKKLSQAAAWLNQGLDYIWSLPDAELTEFLNALGKEKVEALMRDHYVTGCTINARLDAINSHEAQTRCVVTAGREIIYDGQSYSVVPRQLPPPPEESPPQEPTE